MAEMNPDSNDSPKIPSFKPTRKSEDEKKGAGGPLSGLGKPAGGTSGTGGSGAANPLSSLGKSSVGSKGTSLPSTGGSGGFKFPGFSGGKKGAGAGAAGMRIRGMSGGGGSLMDRLKNLRRKDLMFIGAGLATLMMAPVAEHFMMTPEENVGALEEGFDSKGPLFPDGSTVYESGTGGFSPGGLVGSGTDVITPLNVRDPSALVMGPGAKQKPEAVVTPPPVASSSSSNDDSSASKWKDALAESAKSGVREAVRKSPKLPRPSVKMQGALRGLSALSGSSKGGGASFKLPGLSASNVPNSARGSNSLTRSQAAPGFRGAARRSNASGSGLEGLRGAAGRQADMFSQAGNAGDGLQTAANVALPFPGGGGRGGFGGPGGNDSGGKNPGGNQIKENKQLGESLEFLRRKMEQDKRIGLKWKKKEWNQFGRQKALEEGAIKLAFDAFGKIIVEPIAEMGKKLAGQLVEPSGASASSIVCYYGAGTNVGHKTLTNAGKIRYECIGNAAYSSTDGGPPVKVLDCAGGCRGAAGSATKTEEELNRDRNGRNQVFKPEPGNASGQGLGKICELLNDPKIKGSGVPAFEKFKGHLLSASKKIVGTRNSIVRMRGGSSDCGATKYYDPNGQNTVKWKLSNLQDNVITRDAVGALRKMNAGTLGPVNRVGEHVAALSKDPVEAKLGEGMRTEVNRAEVQKWEAAKNNEPITKALEGIATNEANFTKVDAALKAAEADHKPVAEALKKMRTEMDAASATDLAAAQSALTTALADPQFKDPTGRKMAEDFFKDISDKHRDWNTALGEQEKKSAMLGGTGEDYAPGGEKTNHAIANTKAMLQGQLKLIDGAYVGIGAADGTKVDASPRTEGVDFLATDAAPGEKWASGYLPAVETEVKKLTTAVAAGKDNDPTDPGVKAMVGAHTKLKPLAEQYVAPIGLKESPMEPGNTLWNNANASLVEKIPSAKPGEAVRH